MATYSDVIGHDVIGLIPAAGLGTRIGPLAGSKELFPIGFHQAGQGGALKPKPVCLYLLEALRRAGIRRTYIVLRNGKWDIPAYLGDGHGLGMDLAYLIMRLPFGAPFSLDQAYPFIQDSVVALGFPDIIFEPSEAYVYLLDHLHTTGADVVLGLFPTEVPHTADMVELTGQGRVLSLDIKPSSTDLSYTWGMAVWLPSFTHFMHEQVRRHAEAANDLTTKEFFIGHVFQRAIDVGLRVEGVLVSEQPYLDIGVPQNLMKAIRRFTSPA